MISQASPEATLAVISARLKARQPYVLLFPTVEAQETPEGFVVTVHQVMVNAGELPAREEYFAQVVAGVCSAVVEQLAPDTGESLP